VDTDQLINKYLPYLMEVRNRILWIVSASLVGGILGFFLYDRIIGLAISFLNIEGVNIAFTSPFQYIELAINSAVVFGIITAFPFILAQLVSFLRPALKPPEFRLLVSLLPLAIILFVGGFIFGAVMMRYVIVIFQQSSARLGIGNILDVGSLLSAILSTSALMGIAFQFPLILTTLIYFKVVKYATVAKQRPFAYLAVFIFAMMLPPTDILTDFILAVPLVFLFELTLLLNKFIKGR